MPIVSMISGKKSTELILSSGSLVQTTETTARIADSEAVSEVFACFIPLYCSLLREIIMNK